MIWLRPVDRRALRWRTDRPRRAAIRRVHTFAFSNARARRRRPIRVRARWPRISVFWSLADRRRGL